MNIRGDLKAVTQISLTNIFGEKVAEVIGPFKSNSCFLELGNLPIGVYYLTVEEAEDSFIQKVVRQ